jgi:hypothetical protein
MTAFDRKALAALVVVNGLIGPQAFGERLWSHRPRGSSSAPFARIAGKVLNRLRDQGFAEWVSEHKSWGWRATPEGRREAAR